MQNGNYQDFYDLRSMSFISQIFFDIRAVFSVKIELDETLATEIV